MELSQKNAHNLRTVLAIATAAGISALLKLPNELWIYITIAVVLMPLPYSGSTAERALMRALGTILGGIWAIVSILIYDYSGNENLYYILLGVGLLIGIRASTGKYPYAALLFVLTIALMGAEPDEPLVQGIWRMANVILGCLIAYVFVFFPKRLNAFDQWQKHLLAELNLLSDILTHDHHEDEHIRRYLTEFSKKLVSQRALVAHIQKEVDVDQFDVEEAQRVIRRIVSTAELITRTQWVMADDELALQHEQALKDFKTALQSKIVSLSEGIRSGKWENNRLDHERIDLLAARLRIPKEVTHHDYSYPANVWLHRQLAKQLIQLAEMFQRR